MQDLGYQMQGDVFKLTWSIPVQDATFGFPLAGFRVYRSKERAVESDCQNCPVRFAKAGEVLIREKEANKAAAPRMHFFQRLESGYRYVYKVRAYNVKGAESRDSNFIEFVYR
ncbi:MAG: hypothetical protein JSW39_03505 [Desulfobacterales bacterium]|nr:MAG: hypothetical protein JSW39_03505 [Desulfobacterales bacterium]